MMYDSHPIDDPTESTDDEEATADYECLRCGAIEESSSHPGQCADCGGDMVGRDVPLE